MNSYQILWWQQAKSDHEAFQLLRRQGIAQCHLLHYLQMVTEKIAKAYFWHDGSSPPKSHAGFAKFLRALGGIQPLDQERIANLFAFTRFKDFQYWIEKPAMPIAYGLERLAPALANNGPNPEYPWPHEQPEYAPANYDFPIWALLTSGRGRTLMTVIGLAVDRFLEYADT